MSAEKLKTDLKANADAAKPVVGILGGATVAGAAVGAFGGPAGAVIGAGVGAIVGGISAVIYGVKNKDSF